MLQYVWGPSLFLFPCQQIVIIQDLWDLIATLGVYHTVAKALQCKFYEDIPALYETYSMHVRYTSYTFASLHIWKMIRTHSWFEVMCSCTAEKIY